MDSSNLFDLNGDGIIDAVGVDNNANGYHEAFHFDTTGDNVPDTAYLDANENGYAEGVAVDTNGDGVLDALTVDLDENGVAEATYPANVPADPMAAFDGMGGTVGGQPAGPIVDLLHAPGGATNPAVIEIINSQLRMNEVALAADDERWD